MYKLRWPTTVTSKQKFKSLAANSNHSQQIQITHSKLKTTHSTFKLLTANNKSTTANYKTFASNSNRSHQIQIAHSKYKSLTANTNTVSVKGECGLRTADCRLRTRGKSRLRVKCRLQTKGKIQSEYRRVSDLNLMWAFCFDVTVVGHHNK